MAGQISSNTIPQSFLGHGLFDTNDWKKCWCNYNPEGASDDHGTVAYEVNEDDIEGILPPDLIGTLYRNGPGRFGVNGQRVAHVLDSDGLIIKFTFSGDSSDKVNDNTGKCMFQSRLVLTKGYLEDIEAGTFQSRGTFGTAVRGWPKMFPPKKKGLDEEPEELPLISKIVGNAFNTNIKNTANTQVIAFGGKLLALFEAGCPYELDPITLETIGEVDLTGTMKPGAVSVKIPSLPSDLTPDFVGGESHTAHPQLCPRTKRLVGWTWSQLPITNELEIQFIEWNSVKEKGFEKHSSSTFTFDCGLAPHDMAMTENCIIMMANALTMDTSKFLSGLNGPAASLSMDGRAPVKLQVFPRPSSLDQFEPFAVDVPPCFVIHWSHAYECTTEKGDHRIVGYFSGWPSSDSTDFLGDWGGMCPEFSNISPTYLWRIEVDTSTRQTVSFGVAPGGINVCGEHPVVHPKFNTRKAKSTYVVASNLNGDSTAPCGYVRIPTGEDNCVNVSDMSSSHAIAAVVTEPVEPGERNELVDAHWVGPRSFAGEPLVVPRANGDPDDENDAFLLGMVQDAERNKSYLAIYDLRRTLAEGPVARVWLKSMVPHGLHGCFSADGDICSTSVFC